MDAPAAAAVVTILGSGTCIPDRARHSAAYHLELGSSRILLDCGPGTLHGLDAHGVPWQWLTHVAVSHYHTDHVGDLSAVLFALEFGTRPPREDPLTLIGPVGFGAFVGGLGALLGEHLLRPSFGLRVAEVAPGAPFVDAGGDFVLEACGTPHTDESIAFRVRGEWGTVGYTGDTGPSQDVATFLRGCELLIAECSLADPPTMDRHLSPVGVAELARIARPGLLVVTHVYPPLTPDLAVAQVGEHYAGATVAGVDGMGIRIGPEGAQVAARP